MFELPPGVVHSIISKMIINEELQVTYTAYINNFHALGIVVELGVVDTVVILS